MAKQFLGQLPFASYKIPALAGGKKPLKSVRSTMARFHRSMHFRGNASTQQRRTRQCFQSGNSLAAEETVERDLIERQGTALCCGRESIDRHGEVRAPRFSVDRLKRSIQTPRHRFSSKNVGKRGKKNIACPVSFHFTRYYRSKFLTPILLISRVSLP